MTSLTHTPKYDIAYKSGSYGPYLSEIPTLYLPNDAKLEDLNLTIIEWFQLINADPGTHPRDRPLLTRSFNRDYTYNDIDIHFRSNSFIDDMNLSFSDLIMDKFKSLGYTSFPVRAELTQNAKAKYSYKSVLNILDRLGEVKETIINTLINAIQIEFDDAIESVINEVFEDKDLGPYLNADQFEAASKIVGIRLQKEKEEIRLKLVAAEAEVKKLTAQMEGCL